MLQWGHNFFVMEIDPPLILGVNGVPCFNGAITFSLWKYDADITFHPRLIRFNGAITFSLWKFALVAI